MSDQYIKLCKAVNKRFGASRVEIIEKRKEKKEKYLEARRKLKDAERDLVQALVLHGKDSLEYKKCLKEKEKKSKKYKVIQRSYTKAEFDRTAEFIGYDVEEEEIMLLSVFGAFVTFMILLVIVSIFHLTYGLSFISVLLWVIPLFLAAPMGVLVYLANYPEIRSQQLKAKTIGSAPEGINYMTMSMRAHPSLHNAILFAANNVDEPLASRLKKAIWEVYLRQRSSLEDSIIALAGEWGEWNDDLKRSLYVIRSSVLENTQEGLEATLQRANDIITTGTKQKIRDFSNSLKTPTTILFALGILLPLIIGAMMPMMTLGGLDLTSIYQEQAEQTGGLKLAHVVLLMNILIPFGAFVYSYKILINRPGTTVLPSMDTDEKTAYYIPSAILVSGLILVWLFRTQLEFLMPLPWIWAPVLAVSYYLISSSWKQRKQRMEILELEKEFPDALFQLGSRMAEGKSLEKSIEETGKSMSGSKAGNLFKNITTLTRLKRMPLKDALFGNKGILNSHPSRTIKASMKSVISVSQKSPPSAGTIILQNSEYLKDMQEMEKDIRSELVQSVEMMEATSMFFAPVVMGIIVALYSMLYRVFMDISGQGIITPYEFTLVIAGYLLTMSAVITYFSVGIKYQSDPTEFKFALGRVLMVCTIILTIVILIGQSFLVW
ncbi:MAG: hypothetical protein R6U17_01400 [Thermoplasmata archaeon]